MLITISVIIFSILTGVVVLFQGFLAAGMPWGEASMGGKFPGKYPPVMRIVAVINMIILAMFNLIVLVRAGVLFSGLVPFAKIGIWIVIVFFIFGTILNIITPSKIERIWAPVAGIQLITSIIIAVS